MEKFRSICYFNQIYIKNQIDFCKFFNINFFLFLSLSIFLFFILVEKTIILNFLNKLKYRFIFTWKMLATKSLKLWEIWKSDNNSVDFEFYLGIYYHACTYS